MYWVIEQDRRIEGIATVMDVPDDFDILDWLRSTMPPPRSPLELTLSPGSGDFRGDIIGGAVILFSNELVNTLRRFGVNNVIFHSIKLKNPHTGDLEIGYSLVYIMGLVACVVGYGLHQNPLEKPTCLERFSVDPKRTLDYSIFRLKENPHLILISNELHDFLKNENMVGVRMRPTTHYTVWG